jgi:hypothetical protein
MFKKEEFKKISTFIGIFIILFCASYLLSHIVKKEEAKLSLLPPLVETTRELPKETAKDNLIPPIKNNTGLVTLEIDGSTYKSELLQKETTVYDLMDQLRKEGKINFKEKNYAGIGKFIDEINGVRGDGERYWIYYVNEVEATVGVSDYKVKTGDVISWKYQKDI